MVCKALPLAITFDGKSIGKIRISTESILHAIRSSSHLTRSLFEMDMDITPTEKNDIQHERTEINWNGYRFAQTLCSMLMPIDHLSTHGTFCESTERKYYVSSSSSSSSAVSAR